MSLYRFIDDPRRTIRFRNATCELWLANLGQEWAWVAEKVGDPSSRVVLAKNANIPALRGALTTGFVVDAGGLAEKT